MIYTVTVNPAVDYIMKMTDSLKEGGTNRASSELIAFGGKGINVSTVLHGLGIENIAMGFTAGFTGKALEDGLRRKGIKTDFIRLKSGLTRINVKLLNGAETEINGCGPYISTDAADRLIKKLACAEKNDIIILSGSLQKSLPVSFYEKIMLALPKDRHVKVAADTCGESLRRTLKHSPFLVKPNRKELEELAGERLSSMNDIICAAKKLHAAGAENVLVSLGGDGAVIVCGDGNACFCPALGGKPVNTVGAGDSMVAGFTAGISGGRDVREAFELACAAGGAAACLEGLPGRDDVMRLLPEAKAFTMTV